MLSISLYGHGIVLKVPIRKYVSLYAPLLSFGAPEEYQQYQL